MPVEIKFREIGDVVIVDCKGEMKLEFGATDLRNTILQLIKEGKKKIILNLAETTYADSSGLAELISAFTRTSNVGGRLKLLSLTEKLTELLKITKLFSIFEVFDDENKAIKSFN